MVRSTGVSLPQSSQRRRSGFPTLEYIYAEIAKITGYRQRRTLGIERRYMVVTTVVVTHVEAVLDQTVAAKSVPLNTTNYLIGA